MGSEQTVKTPKCPIPNYALVSNVSSFLGIPPVQRHSPAHDCYEYRQPAGARVTKPTPPGKKAARKRRTRDFELVWQGTGQTALKSNRNYYRS